MHKLQLWVLLSIFGLSSLLFADQVVLSNGDRLTGTITKSDGKTLVIKTDLAGEITIQWTAVQSLTSATPLHVVTAAKTVVGPVTTSDGSLAVSTTPGGPVEVPRAEVTALRNDQAQAAYEKSLHPSLLQGWVGGANIGFALTGGNSETKNHAIAFTADRKTSHDEIALYTNTSYTSHYRGTFNFGTITKISKWLGWQNAFGDIYVTNPPVGKKQNDVQLTT